MRPHIMFHTHTIFKPLNQLSIHTHSLSGHSVSHLQTLFLVCIFSNDPFQWWSFDILSLNFALMHYHHKIPLIHSYHLPISSESTMLHPFSHSIIHMFRCYTNTETYAFTLFSSSHLVPHAPLKCSLFSLHIFVISIRDQICGAGHGIAVLEG